MHNQIIFILTVFGFVTIDIFLFIKLFNLFYRRKGEFEHNKKYIYEPNILSLFDGTYWDNTIAKTKFGIYIICCLMIIIGEILLIDKLNLILTTFDNI